MDKETTKTKNTKKDATAKTVFQVQEAAKLCGWKRIELLTTRYKSDFSKHPCLQHQTKAINKGSRKVFNLPAPFVRDREKTLNRLKTAFDNL